MANVKDKDTFNISKEDIRSKLENSKYKGRHEIYETYLEQDKDRWGRGKHKKFENSLKDANLFYFAYIKFYLNEGKEYALVAGKSGSYNVNYSGSDVRFREYPKKGKAKEWLYNNNKKWCKERILIIKTIAEEKEISEKEAFEIEKYLVNTFGLCES
ncbi:hypothetical protein [Clostridium guangxiense]|uniref:hypothetical protein n=1 Tax=Clostridium guangxiense TaxID=1662055 RepID=UPI001E5D7EDC|nr:hypothetical protein [Clostridium guangxiense]MCD2348548.1 hypothetical protein [Clostridium guangxiense]